MNSRWAGLFVCLLIAVAGLSLGTGCDPCGSCSSSAKPTGSPTPAPNQGLPSSSIAVLVQGTNATAYLPQGNWEGGDSTNCASDSGQCVVVLPIETSAGIGTGGAPTPIAVADVPNSCSSNSTTGQTVCVSNDTDVYLISGTTLLNTVTDGATGDQGFSGGDCETCGVVADSTTNRALLTIGLSTDAPIEHDVIANEGVGVTKGGEAGGGAYQFLDLGGTPAFEAPIPAGAETSEDVSIDPGRHFILSPNEQSNYQIVKFNNPTPALFNNPIDDGELDSAAEDGTTGIALSTVEGTGDLFITDLTQATFTPGTPGTWTDTASQLVNFPEFDDLSAGTCGIAVAPGTHLGVVAGEFGGDIEGFFQLPASSGSGTPSFVDYVAFEIPSPPTEEGWSQGFDPHTVTSYVSPNTKKAYALFENGDFSYVAVIDMQAMLNAPRTGAHTVTTPIPAGIVTFIAE